MRVPIRTSRLSKWSRRLGGFAFPLVALTLVLRLTGLVEPDVFEICIVLASILAVLAVGLGIAAYVRLWFTGDRGWGAASVGLASGLISLVPMGAALTLVVLYPATIDISTDPLDPPQLSAAEPGRETPVDPAEILESFPNLLGRSYQVEPTILYGLARAQAESMGWQVIGWVDPAETGGQGRLNVWRDSLLHWPSEIVIRIAPGALGSEVHVRAASIRDIVHDLGENGRALEAFLIGLDATVTQYVTDNLVDSGDDEDLPEVIVDDPDEEDGAASSDGM